MSSPMVNKEETERRMNGMEIVDMYFDEDENCWMANLPPTPEEIAAIFATLDE